jgi:hypothetical protein
VAASQFRAAMAARQETIEVATTLADAIERTAEASR